MAELMAVSWPRLLAWSLASSDEHVGFDGTDDRYSFPAMSALDRPSPRRRSTPPPPGGRRCCWRRPEPRLLLSCGAGPARWRSAAAAGPVPGRPWPRWPRRCRCSSSSRASPPSTSAETIRMVATGNGIGPGRRRDGGVDAVSRRRPAGPGPPRRSPGADSHRPQVGQRLRLAERGPGLVRPAGGGQRRSTNSRTRPPGRRRASRRPSRRTGGTTRRPRPSGRAEERCRPGYCW